MNNTTHNNPISEDFLAFLVHELRASRRPAYQRLWDYYRNDLDFSDDGEQHSFTAAQQRGLPRRLTRRAKTRREVVIENDIAWRIHALVDFMFGKEPVIQSLAPDRATSNLVERVLRAALDAAGGACFFQQMALLGSVYGFVDLLVRPGSGTPIAVTSSGAPSKHLHPEAAVHAASQLVIETVEAPRAIGVPDPDDYRRLCAYVLHYTRLLNEVEHDSFLSRLVDSGGVQAGRQRTQDVTEIWTADSIRTQHDGVTTDERPNTLGVLPVVHIQNLPQPFFYEGLSEVEPLIPLQDELNTRLSDRANRVTLQSFKMYLGKGIENFSERPVGPGQVWLTHNRDASIEAFGGDAESPSELAHIQEIRDAMDKSSAVTPIAAGLLRSKVGNLSSENALRIAMMGLLARTERKRVTYGKGIGQLCELILHALHVQGVLKTTEAERRIRIHWPSPLPENFSQRLRDAEIKLRLGVPQKQVLAELGYGEEEI